MEYVTELIDAVADLDRKKIISIKWITVWFISLTATVVAIHYGWNYLFEDSVDDHFPKSFQNFKDGKYTFTNAAESRQHYLKHVNIVIFSCLDNYMPNKDRNNSIISEVQNTMRTIKSAAFFSTLVIHFHIYSTDDVFQSLVYEVSKWPYKILHRISFEFHPASSPESVVSQNLDPLNQKHVQWKSCDFSYMFLPTIMKGMKPIFYVKPGSIFLTSVDIIWKNMLNCTENQVISLPRLIKHPMCLISDDVTNIEKIFGTSIVLFDIFWLHSTNFVVPVAKKSTNQTLLPIDVNNFKTVRMAWDINMIVSIFSLFRSVIRKPDVDIFNILATFNPDKFNELPCSWNYDLKLCETFGINQCSSASMIIKSQTLNDDYLYDRIVEKIDSVDFNYTLSLLQDFLQNKMVEIYKFTSSPKCCLYENWKAILSTIISNF